MKSLPKQELPKKLAPAKPLPKARTANSKVSTSEAITKARTANSKVAPAKPLSKQELPIQKAPTGYRRSISANVSISATNESDL